MLFRSDLRGSPPVASTPRPPKQETLTFPATVAHLQALVARVLGGQTVPDTEQGFAELGLDSLMAVELKKLVEETFGRQLSATVVFNYPSISRLAAHLIGQSDPAVTPSTPQAAAVDARQLLAQLAQEAEE